MTRRRVSVLGSTGSIGTSTLSLLEASGVEVEVVALVGGENVELLADQALRWRPAVAVVHNEALLPDLRDRLRNTGVEVAAGREAVVAAAGRDADWVMSAIVGFAGLAPTLAAADTGATVALANKESMICAGPALMRRAQAAGGNVIPVDSEHSAIFQVLDERHAAQVRRLILTASGGPFRTWSLAQMAAATPQQALAHPRWQMGARISVDSATMMNKGLELIEAAYLFGVPEAQIEVVIHPQSVMHSLVEYADGSMLAQLGVTDMRVPIAYALAWPDRLAWPAGTIDLADLGRLDFEAPQPDLFPALGLARSALNGPAGAPIVLNAADEVAVDAFLSGRIGFLQIAETVERTLDRAQRHLIAAKHDGSLESATALDGGARRHAHEILMNLAA